MNKVRKFFTPGAGSRARNIARAVIPTLVALSVPGFRDLDGTQVSLIVIATEVVFSGGFVANKE